MLLQCSKTLPIPSGNLLNLFTLKNNHVSVHYSRNKRQMRQNNYDDAEDDWYVFDTVEEVPHERNDSGQFIPNNNNVQFGAQRPWPRPSKPPAPTTSFIPAFPSAGPPRLSRCEEDCNRQTATSQYNPVCGSNSVTYINLGRLNCAALCGTSIFINYFVVKHI